MQLCTYLRLIALVAVSLPGMSLGETIWSLGTDDHNHAEFAASGAYASFPQRFSKAPEVRIGSADPCAQWPWIHPGPVDQWAGSRSHTFSILFDLPRDCNTPAFELVLDTIAAHFGDPPVLEVDLNGHSHRIHTRATCRNDDVLGDPKLGQAASYRAVFLADWLKPKDNRLTIANVQGSWLLYDCISLGGKTAEISELNVTAAHGVLRGPDAKPCRRLTIDYAGGVLTEVAELAVRSDAGQLVQSLDPENALLGADILLPVTTFEKPLHVTVTLTYQGKTIERAVTIPPQRRWEVHLVHQTHLDIGYTHTQEDVLARQVQSLKDSLEYIEETRDYPEPARFRFHPEGMWAVEEFMRTATDDEKQALIRATQQRDIHLDAMYAQAMTGMYNDEELFELMACAARFGKQHQVVVDSAMQTDVPGYTWGLVPALAQNGVRYMTMGPNNGHRVGRVYHWADRPFWWESPSGKHRVLCWVSSYGYAAWHGQPLGHRIQEDRMFKLLERFETKDYPFDLVMLRYNIEGDNGRPNRVLSDCVKDWNERYLWPQLRISRNSDVMREVERRYGDQLPVLRGDYTPYWEDGCASTSAATALCRQGCERIIQAQTLFAMLSPADYSFADFDATWTDLIMYDEHTWGAYCSISRPDDPFTIHQDDYKQAFAKRGYRVATELVARAVGQRSDDDGSCVRVFNTASWTRSGLMTIDTSSAVSGPCIRDDQGRVIPSQRLVDGMLAFVATDVPGFGGKRFFVDENSDDGSGKAAMGTAQADADSLTIGNDRLILKIDPASGAIASVRFVGIDSDLVQAGDDGNRGLNDYLYILGRDSAENRMRHAGGVEVSVVEAGPLVAKLRIESAAPNSKRLVREITVFDGSDEIVIENRLDKIMERQPEGTFFGFPFNVPDGQWRIDVPWAVVRPEIDQLPGANRNYYCVQRWCDLSNDEFGVTWATLDANMMQFAPIRYTPTRDIEAWRTEIEPGGTLYSWVCNNHWETNYKAGQEGPLIFRYVLRPHAGRYDQAAAQRFARAAHQPLLAVRTNERVPVTDPPLSLDNDAVVATCLKPTRDGRGLLLRLFNTTDANQTATIDARKTGSQIYRSNPLEEQLELAPQPLSLDKYEIITLRIE